MKNFDDVVGVIIGGNYGQCWVTYEGRKQGATGYPYDEVEADAYCQSVVDGYRAEFGDYLFNLIYPNKQGWVFHFDGV